jgi:hypothetical protein
LGVIVRKLFVSYARENKRDVDQLVEHLGTMGYQTWVDADLRGGQEWWEEILARIAESDVVIAIYSAAALNSTACSREFEWAVALGKPVVPVAVEPPPTALPSRFARRQIIDYSEPAERPLAALKLQGALATLPPAPPLPDPLPEPPKAPLSYLTDLIDLITQANALDHDQQHQILHQLEPALTSFDPLERRGGDDILQRFSARRDLYADVDRAITRLRQLPTQPVPVDSEPSAQNAASTAEQSEAQIDAGELIGPTSAAPVSSPASAPETELTHQDGPALESDDVAADLARTSAPSANTPPSAPTHGSPIPAEPSAPAPDTTDVGRPHRPVRPFPDADGPHTTPAGRVDQPHPADERARSISQQPTQRAPAGPGKGVATGRQPPAGPLLEAAGSAEFVGLRASGAMIALVGAINIGALLLTFAVWYIRNGTAPEPLDQLRRMLFELRYELLSSTEGFFLASIVVGVAFGLAAKCFARVVGGRPAAITSLVAAIIAAGHVVLIFVLRELLTTLHMVAACTYIAVGLACVSLRRRWAWWMIGAGVLAVAMAIPTSTSTPFEFVLLLLAGSAAILVTGILMYRDRLPGQLVSAPSSGHVGGSPARPPYSPHMTGAESYVSVVFLSPSYGSRNLASASADAGLKLREKIGVPYFALDGVEHEGNWATQTRADMAPGRHHIEMYFRLKGIPVKRGKGSADFTTSGGPVYVSQEFAQYLTTTQVDIDGEPTIRRRRLHF